MVTYVVLRGEVPGGIVVELPGGKAIRKWHSTEVLAKRYSNQPDQLQKALLAALHPRYGNVFSIQMYNYITYIHLAFQIIHFKRN